MEQWFFKITSYADALLEGHATIDWPERTKKIQSDWIGRSEGAEVLFRVTELDIDIPVFTTRPDTLFGATFSCSRPRARSSTAGRRNGAGRRGPRLAAHRRRAADGRAGDTARRAASSRAGTR